jgi:aspartate/methionine/tyrosine aminotransferase
VVQPGGKPVIGKFIQTVMNPGDEVLYPNPGYPIYESQIEYYGGKSRRVPLRRDADGLRARHRPPARSQITPRSDGSRRSSTTTCRTRCRARAAPQEMEAIRPAGRSSTTCGCWPTRPTSRCATAGTSTSIAIAAGHAGRTVILYTFSKKFAMTGWRLGAAIAPVPIAESLAKLNTNDEIVHHALRAVPPASSRHHRPAVGPKAILDVLRDAARRLRSMGVNAIDGMHAARPEATFYLFVNVTGAMMARRGFDDVAAFRDRRAARDRRVVLHAQALRPPAARRDRTVHPARLLGHRRHATSREALQRLRDWVSA